MSRAPLRRLVFLVPGAAALVAGLWGGLLRVPVAVPWPVDHAWWLTHHGALMVGGFIGTLVGIERAVGSGARWPYAAPLLTGAGGIAVVVGDPTTGLPLLVAGSAWFTLVGVVLARKYSHAYLWIMAAAGAAWTVGNGLVWCDTRVPDAVWWWAAFLGWTIVAERLELTRLVRLPRSARGALYAALSAQLVGTLAGTSHPWAQRVVGATLLLQAAWLVVYDIARRNARLPGVAGFTARCLVIGYVWLALTGVLLLGASPLAAGSTYDAALHAFFLGFVFAMIFGHAPIILPSVLGLRLRFSRFAYVHLAVLQVSLATRVVADLAGLGRLRAISAAGNVAAIAIFLAFTIGSALRGQDAHRASG